MVNIEKLNSKVWYRGLKVIYVIFFLFIIIVGSTFILDIIESDIKIERKNEIRKLNQINYKQVEEKNI